MKDSPVRDGMGLMRLAEIESLAGRGVLIPAPNTVLISSGIQIGNGTILWPGSVLLAKDPSDLTVGENCEIGAEGGFWLDARTSQAIRVGNSVRLLGGGACEGPCNIGDGAQILGAIRCRSCRLAGGGRYLHPDPDQRGAVLKGNGVARSIDLERGEVIQAFGLFAEAPVRRQLEFHPP